ncbi:hypothetical protein OF001_U120133 [Pseudomonas sp. OF001]|nr:hypothetical protein OF001_U120133 [Pseudomonas sp. OF001]
MRRAGGVLLDRLGRCGAARPPGAERRAAADLHPRLPRPAAALISYRPFLDDQSKTREV